MKLVHLVVCIAGKRSTVAVADLHSVPVVEICRYAFVYQELRIRDLSGMDVDDAGEEKTEKPGLTARLLLMMPVKAISFSMWSDEPRPVPLLSRHVLTLLHHAPPCIAHGRHVHIREASISVFGDMGLVLHTSANQSQTHYVHKEMMIR
jgi:hypothetical protein